MKLSNALTDYIIVLIALTPFPSKIYLNCFYCISLFCSRNDIMRLITGLNSFLSSLYLFIDYLLIMVFIY